MQNLISKVFGLSICLLIGFSSYGQEDRVLDSLFVLIETASEDSVRFDLYEKVAHEYYRQTNFEAVQEYINERIPEVKDKLSKAENAEYTTMLYNFLGKFHRLKTVCYYRAFKFDEAWVQLDSAKQYFELTENEGALAHLYNDAGIICHYESKPDSAFVYYTKCFELASKVKDTTLMIRASYNQAGIYKRKMQMDDAIRYYKKVGDLAKAIKSNAYIGDAHKGMADVHYFNSSYVKAIEHYTKAIELFEMENDLQGLNNALSNISNIYKEQGEYDAALKNLRRALSISKKRRHEKGTADTYISIGSVYSNIPVLDSCLYYYRKALQLHLKIDYKPGYAMAYANLGNKLVERDSLSKGLTYLNRSVGLYKELNDQHFLLRVLSLLAKAQLKNNDAAGAEKTIKEAHALSTKLGAPAGIANTAEVYAEVLKTRGRYRQAYELLEESKIIQDTLRTAEIKEKTIRADLQLEYQAKSFQDSIRNEREKYMAELQYQASLNKEKSRRNLLIYISLAVLALAIGLYSRIRYVARTKKLLQKEKDRSDALLLNILPYEIAEELKIKGESEARGFDQVTVLFSDFISFTETATKLTAKELVAEINICFKAFDNIMQKYDIEKIKTIGDSYMAAAGLHKPVTAGPKEVVLAGLEMQSFIEERKAIRQSQGIPYFEMRLGIHTGPVVAGIVGVKKFQYDIWGDTVNTASRMESQGIAGKVNISQDSYELLKDDPAFVFEFRGKITAKGKGEVEMWFVSRA